MQNKNAFVSQKEVPFPSGATLVSKTDTKGITTYANDAFVALSGYTREELFGKSHNIVRHPDMPPQAFKWLWDTVKTGRPWRGIVKNRCKNGDHYWVSATVVPLMEDGKITGYMSVRKAPTRSQVAEAETLYRHLNQTDEEIESKYEGWKFKNWPIQTKMQVLIQSTLFILLLGAQLFVRAHFEEHDALLAKQLIYGHIGLHIIMFFGIIYFVNHIIMSPLRGVEKCCSDIIQGDLSTDMEISIRDEMGSMMCKMQIMDCYLHTMVDEIVQAEQKIRGGIKGIDVRVGVVAGNVVNEQDNIQAMTASMEQFSQSVSEVANMAADSQIEAKSMQRIVKENDSNMGKTIAATSKVAVTVQSSSKTISDLGESIRKIGAISNTIKEIADQTNLLALNAAIEAARAGDQGRGFAVVADEVRKLAERTSASTKDIANTIEEINTISDAAVSSMLEAVADVENGIALIRKNGDGLKEILIASVNVSDKIGTIALESKQQSEAGHSMAQNLEKIMRLVDSNTVSANDSKAAADELMKSSEELRKAGYPLTKTAR